MPNYSYVCRSCEHALEVHQSFAEDALVNCPECSGELRKQFGNLGVSFKGAGFYKNDSASPEPSSSES
jgi:putative FmdB family regulatory protein